MEDRPRKQGQLRGLEVAPGLEELNLVEFPLAVLADTAPKGIKTLEFEDLIFDKASGTYVRRRCVVTGSDKWGLPNWFDIDVVLALMKMTNEQNGFQDRAVKFSLYGLRQVLGISASHGRYKSRLKEGLLRILGTTIAYENAWRSDGKWKSTTAFHLLDNLELTNTREFFDEDADQHLKWNERVVESVQASNTKGLDWEFYMSLERPSAKRLYRFLDKRFGLRSQWSYELTSFCPNKLGMNRGQAAWVYRKSLKPGIDELVTRGVLDSLPDDKLFTKEGKVSFVNFRRRLKTSAVRTKSPEKPKPGGIEGELLERGVNNAAELVAAYPENKIREQIENFDDRNKHGEDRTPGWLRRAIEDEQGFGCRKGFKTSAQRELEKKKTEELKRKKVVDLAMATKQREEEEQRATETWNAFVRCRDSIDVEKRIELEDEYLEDCNEFLRKRVLEARRSGEVSGFHQLLWEEHIIPNLEKVQKSNLFHDASR